MGLGPGRRPGFGYVDSEEEGRLTGAVRKSPYRVVLLDEVDKAHPAVLNLLLQIAAGHLTDGRGRRVSFSNTVVIMTSNHGGSAGVRKRSIGLVEQKAAVDPQLEHKARYLRAGMTALTPELIGRIGVDRMIVFNNLGVEEYRHILELRLAELNKTVKPKGMTVRLAAAAAMQAIKKALGLRTYGARPLRDVVNREVATAMADAELAGTIQRGDSVVVDVTPDGRYEAKPE